MLSRGPRRPAPSVSGLPEARGGSAPPPWLEGLHPLLEALQIGRDRLRLVIGQPQHRHLDARLERTRVFHPRGDVRRRVRDQARGERPATPERREVGPEHARRHAADRVAPDARPAREDRLALDRKSTRLDSSHLVISYAVFCLKKKDHLESALVWCYDT